VLEDHVGLGAFRRECDAFLAGAPTRRWSEIWSVTVALLWCEHNLRKKEI
jgi:hypothetical protein